MSVTTPLCNGIKMYLLSTQRHNFETCERGLKMKIAVIVHVYSYWQVLKSIDLLAQLQKEGMVPGKQRQLPSSYTCLK